MIEVALVFDTAGKTLYRHLPPGRSGGWIPDSRALWEVLWENRHRLGGVAHTHPWRGSASPSNTDITTFAAVEAALGKRLQWLIVTFSEVRTFEWQCPYRLSYRERSTPNPLRVSEVAWLREESKKQ